MIFEVRWHGRGGQGCWTASTVLALAALSEGKSVQSFPEFGPERMGAPVQAFTRISDKKIRMHCNIYRPNAVVVLDPTLLGRSVVEGLVEGGALVVNTKSTPSQVKSSLGIHGVKVWTVDASRIALEVLGREITNTPMIGALVKATGVVKIDSVISAVKERFPGELGEKNATVVRRAHDETVGE